MKKAFIRIAGSGVTHVLFAFIVMGCWALFANWSHPGPEALMAGLVQGALSACITLVMKKSLDYLSKALPETVAWWLPPVVVCSVSLAVLVLAHLAAGTPELFATILFPFSVATSYAMIYNLALYRRKLPHD